MLNRLFAALCLAGLAASAHATTVFSTDFDGSLPAEITPGSATLTGVSDFAGLGNPGNVFGGNFLRSMTGNTVTLTLTDLPTHDSLSLSFLFAAIDSLDGTGSFPSGDFFHITLDGVTIFRESFANALASQTQSYVPPAGVELARRVELGFSSGFYYNDSAYDLGADPFFGNIAHTASTATFTFLIEGQGIQSLDDESWAMDNLRVSVNPVPEPETYALMAAGLGILGWRAARRRRIAAL
ncbi:MAG: PEP-CTERM sorting domain-containing protein [Burkholderiales bacterium]|nr:PEP-CTERM sorting domain-containing protein [Burkholderiales bacterium]